MSTLQWATVTAVSPTKVTVDGTATQAAVQFDVSDATAAVNDRVIVDVVGGRLVLIANTTSPAQKGLPQYLLVAGANQATPTSGTSTWINIGNVTVPPWATKAMVQLAIISMSTPNGIVNVTAQMKLGAVGGASVVRIPGSSQNSTHSWAWLEGSFTGLTPGSTVALTLFTTWVAGTLTFVLGTSAIISARVEFAP